MISVLKCSALLALLFRLDWSERRDFLARHRCRNRSQMTGQKNRCRMLNGCLATRKSPASKTVMGRQFSWCPRSADIQLNERAGWLAKSASL